MIERFQSGKRRRSSLAISIDRLNVFLIEVGAEEVAPVAPIFLFRATFRRLLSRPDFATLTADHHHLLPCRDDVDVDVMQRNALPLSLFLPSRLTAMERSSSSNSNNKLAVNQNKSSQEPNLFFSLSFPQSTCKQYFFCVRLLKENLLCACQRSVCEAHSSSRL